MNFPEEDEFDEQFRARLKATRLSMGWSHPRMAHALGVKVDAYKKYENRVRSSFPMYLLPRLIFISDRPYSYWLLGHGEAPGRFKVVK